MKTRLKEVVRSARRRLIEIVRPEVVVQAAETSFILKDGVATPLPKEEAPTVETETPPVEVPPSDAAVLMTAEEIARFRDVVAELQGVSAKAACLLSTVDGRPALFFLVWPDSAIGAAEFELLARIRSAGFHVSVVRSHAQARMAIERARAGLDS